MNKHLTTFIVVLLLSLGAFYFYNKYRSIPAIDVLKLELSDMDGNPFDINSLKGKKTIICFSASWCPNCIRELNSLAKIYDTEMKDINIIVIDDESIDEIKSFKQKKNYPFTFIQLYKNFPDIGINSIPLTYFYNQNMELKKDHLGEIDWDDLSTREHYKAIMDN